MPEAPTTDGDPRLAARQRIRRLSWGALGRIARLQYRLLAAGVTGAVAGAVAQLLLGDWAVAAAVNLAVAALAIVLAALPLRDRRLRAAVEVYADHLQLERVEWKLFTGTKLPSGFRQVERWLREHPDAPHGRPALLVGIGRFEEGLAELERKEVRTPADAYERELIVQQARLFAGERPDLAVLRRDLGTLTEEQRRHRAECLAMLESQLAVDDGRDPIEALATGRDPRGPAHSRARWVLLPLAWLAIALLPSWIALVAHATS